MKLPEDYQSWIEVAKECVKSQAEYPGAKEITFDYHGAVSERLNINTVKSKAFDEVMELACFSKDTIHRLKGNALNGGSYFNDIEPIISFLFKLALCQK